MNLKQAKAKAEKNGHEFYGECVIGNQHGYICINCDKGVWDDMPGAWGLAITEKCEKLSTKSPFKERNFPTKKEKRENIGCVIRTSSGHKTTKRSM